jgi:flagellar biosynthesis GTPase FlhF
MTTIKVSAIDTATAMDQILSQLGADAMILETTTRDGKVEISATNDPDITLKKPNQISDVFTQIMNEELNPHHANHKRYANPMDPKPTVGPILDKDAADKFMSALDEPAPKDKVETEISIHMRRLKWENERLAKEVENQKNESRDSIETAKVFYEQALDQGQENKEALQSFRYEMDGLKNLISDTRQHMVTRSSHRMAMLILVAMMGLSVGAYGMRDHLQAMVPWATSWFQGMGLTSEASMEQIEISELDAVRMGDTVRIKGVVTNHNATTIEAPMIRFMVKDMNGAVLVERDVMLDQDNLMPGAPVQINTQLVMGSQMADDALTDIIAIPMQTPSQKTMTTTPPASLSQTG